MLKINNWYQAYSVVMTGICLTALITLGTIWAQYQYGRITSTPIQTFGEMFGKSDLEGSNDSASLKNIVAVCDDTESIFGGLKILEFHAYAIGKSVDVHMKPFVQIFWKKNVSEHMQIIVTSTNETGTTCIVAISDDVENLLTEEKPLEEGAGKITGL